jgi:hypothetical protein
MSIRTDFHITDRGEIHAVVQIESALGRERKLVTNIERHRISAEALFEASATGFEDFPAFSADENYYCFEDLLDEVIPNWELDSAASVKDGVLEVRAVDSGKVISGLMDYFLGELPIGHSEYIGAAESRPLFF